MVPALENFTATEGDRGPCTTSRGSGLGRPGNPGDKGTEPGAAYARFLSRDSLLPAEDTFSYPQQPFKDSKSPHPEPFATFSFQNEEDEVSLGGSVG